ncbi:MAG: hypothetical protein RQ748_06635 [Elusimicrobiales bacterium]|nr:hypothetical protein [Elusimicrobiales bacterium]
MKKHIVVAAGALCLGVSFTNAEDVVVAFDGPGGKSVNTYITAKMEENRGTPKILVSQAEGKAVSDEAANPYKDKLILVKDLLKDLSQKDRIEFMSGIRLLNGRVASQSYAVLEKRGISRAKTDDILRAFESSAADMKAFTPITARPMIDMEDLLRGVPEKAKAELFDNMKLLNGGVASIKTDLLGKSVSPEKYEEIMDTLMPVVNADKLRAKDEWCETWIVNDWKDIYRSCSYQEKYTCNSAVCK